MPVAPENLRTLDVPDRQQWRDWLRRYHDSESEIWLVFHKPHVPEKHVGYRDALEEALCFGWIDSLIRRLDDQRYARKFTPRKPGSKWSTSNRQLYADLKVRGLLAASGLARPPANRSGDAPRPSLSSIPSYIEEQLKASPSAWSCFEQLAPSCRREYIGWIDSAKRQDTKQRRLQEAIRLLAAGKKLGMK
jgi:uncharacterized protein YdeI (YjbR/CyaY-like superfamily)